MRLLYPDTKIPIKTVNFILIIIVVELISIVWYRFLSKIIIFTGLILIKKFSNHRRFLIDFEFS